MRALAKQDLHLPGPSSRMRVQLMLAGESAIALAARARRVVEFKEQGAPIDFRIFDPYAGEPNSLALMARAPHPHAAQIFLNWFLSREGQSLFQEQSVKSGQRNANSRRTDIAKDIIAPEYRLKDDAVFWENGPNVDQETAEATKLLKAILARRP